MNTDESNLTIIPQTTETSVTNVSQSDVKIFSDVDVTLANRHVTEPSQSNQNVAQTNQTTTKILAPGSSIVFSVHEQNTSRNGYNMSHSDGRGVIVTSDTVTTGDTINVSWFSSSVNQNNTAFPGDTDDQPALSGNQTAPLGSNTSSQNSIAVFYISKVIFLCHSLNKALKIISMC